MCELIWRTISRHVTITSSLASARIFSATFSFFVKLYKNKLRHSFLMATNRQSFLALLLFFAVSFFLRSSIRVLASIINYKRVVNAVRSAGKHLLFYVVRFYHFDTAWCTYANSVWNRTYPNVCEYISTKLLLSIVKRSLTRRSRNATWFTVARDSSLLFVFDSVYAARERFARSVNAQ